MTNITRRTFAAIGAPKGHARCDIVRVETERVFDATAVTQGRAGVVTGVSVRVHFDCQCGRRFDLRDELTAHHNLEAMLMASTIIASPKP